MIRRECWMLVVGAALGLGGCVQKPAKETVLLSRSGPFTLELLNSGTDASLRGVSVVDDRVVWASGSKGTVLRTTDGGATWERRKLVAPTRLDIRDIHGFNADTAIAMATAGRLFRTTDGGEHWKTVYVAVDTSVFLDAISFWDDRYGIVLGDPTSLRAERMAAPGTPNIVDADPMASRFLILLTDNGGETWRELRSVDSPPAEPGEAAFAASGSALIVAGSNDAYFGTGGASVARFYHSANRGRTWVVSHTPIVAGAPSRGIFSVTGGNGLDLLVAGGDYTKPAMALPNLAISQDGGRTFGLIRTRPPQYVSSIIWSRGGSHLLVAGITGIAYSPADPMQWTTLHPGEWNALAAGTGHDWAVGANGRIGRISWRAP